MRRHKIWMAVVAFALAAVGLSACVPPATYTVSGNKILEPDGTTQFVPWGFVIECASFTAKIPAGGLCQASTASPEQNGNNQPGSVLVTEAANLHANTVRFQLAPDNLFNSSGAQTTDACTALISSTASVNTAYVSLVDGLVNEANNDHMVAIVTDQEENDTKTPGPQAIDQAFWQYMACHYAGSAKVFYDVFNEPYGANTFHGTTTPDSVDLADAWACWQNGGTCADGNTYVGMQSLVNLIRGEANNVVVVEGVYHDQDLSQLSTHALTGVSNVAYGFEPNLTSNGVADGSGNDRTAALQDIRFGNIGNTYALMPEAWTGYYYGNHCDPYSANGPDLTNPNAGVNPNGDFPALLAYLHGHNLGLINFSLDPGTNVQYNASGPPTTTTTNSGWGDNTNPNWSLSDCPTKASGPVTEPLGMGALFAYVLSAWSVAQ